MIFVKSPISSPMLNLKKKKSLNVRCTFDRHSRWLYIQQQSPSSSSNRFIENDVSTRKLFCCNFTFIAGASVCDSVILSHHAISFLVTVIVQVPPVVVTVLCYWLSLKIRDHQISALFKDIVPFSTAEAPSWARPKQCCAFRLVSR